MCDKAVNTYPSTIKFVPEWFMAQKMCDEQLIDVFFVLDSILDQYKAHRIRSTVLFEDPSLAIYYPDKYKLK